MKSIIKNYWKQAGILALSMLAMLTSFYLIKMNVNAAEKSIEVKIPYNQKFENDSVETDVDDEFRYSLKSADDKSPMPEGITDAYYYTLKGTTKGELKLDIAFERPGIYTYVAASYVEEAKKGYTYEKGKYTVSVMIVNDDKGGLKQGAVTIQDENLDKYGEIPSNVSYYKKAPSTDTPSKSTPRPTSRPRRRPDYTPSGGNPPPPNTVDIPDDDGFPTDEEEPDEDVDNPEEEPTEEPTPEPTAEIAKPTEKPAPEEEKNEDVWALVNLILTIAMVILSIVDIILFFVNKKKKEDGAEAETGSAETTQKKRHLGLRLATLIPAIAAVVLFLLTEDWSLPYTWIDKWTFWHVIILLVGILLAVLSGMGKKKEEAPTDANPS